MNNDILDVRVCLKTLTLEQLRSLPEEHVRYRVSKGTILHKEGSRISGIYCVHSGILKIFKTGVEGKEQIIKFAKRGDVIGFRSVINREAACTTVKSIEDSVLTLIPSEDLYAFMRANNDFAIELLHIACKELGEANNYITEIAQQSVRERVAEVIISLYNDFGTDAEGFINISLTREELANLVGTATESIIRLLSEFKTNDIIMPRGRKIKIIDMSKLKCISSRFL